jgi:hypothetical protein
MKMGTGRRRVGRRREEEAVKRENVGGKGSRRLAGWPPAGSKDDEYERKGKGKKKMAGNYAQGAISASRTKNFPLIHPSVHSSSSPF